MLSLGGGVIGALVTWLGLPALRALTPRVLPRLDEVTFDASVFVFVAVLCVLTGLVIGTVPAWRSSRPDTTRELPGSARPRVEGPGRRDSACRAPGPANGDGVRPPRRGRSRDSSVCRSARQGRRHRPVGPAELRRAPAARSVRHAQRRPGREHRDRRVQPRRRGPLRPYCTRRCRRCRASSRPPASGRRHSPPRRSFSSGSRNRSTRPTTRSPRSTSPSRKTTSTRWGFA